MVTDLMAHPSGTWRCCLIFTAPSFGRRILPSSRRMLLLTLTVV